MLRVAAATGRVQVTHKGPCNSRPVSLSQILETLGPFLRPASETRIMVNIQTKIKDGKLNIVVDLAKRFGKSASGKSNVIASTHGNVVIDESSGATLGLNVYTKKDVK